jgi:hypothetical protein
LGERIVNGSGALRGEDADSYLCTVIATEQHDHHGGDRHAVFEFLGEFSHD